jgi:phenylacetate-CoA ligase
MNPLASLQLSPGADRPPSGGALYAWAYEQVVFPAWQNVVHGRPIRDHLALLEATQWFPPDELARLRVTALRALLEHAGRHVPYWRELFRKERFDPRAVQSVSDIAVLPVLRREVLLERADEFVDPARRSTNIRKGTSGTTGVPLRFEYCNQSEAWRQAVRMRGYAWAGCRLGRPTLHYWGTGAVIPRGLRARKIALDRALKREVYVDAAHQDEAALQDTARVISRRKPQAIVAYTQALACFARWALERGLRDWPDMSIVCAAEALLPPDREVLTRAFGPHIFETYGSRETMLIAAECEAHAGMHVADENLVVEIARNGRPVGAGEPGEVLVTDLHNYGMPFIRYANGDVATMAPAGRCVCGRHLGRLTSVDGRRADTLRDARGNPVPGMVFVSLLQADTQMLRAFQVVQSRSGSVELKVVPARDWDPSRFEEVTRRLERYFGGLPLRVTICEEIPASASGKRRPIVVES